MSVKPDTEALTHLTLAVFRLNGALLQWGDRLVEPLGLTSARWQMLGAIALSGDALTAPQIGEVMGVTRQGAQKQLHRLLEQGLIESQSNPAHSRSPLYALTPQGRELYQQADALWAAHAAALTQLISAPQARETTNTLQLMLRQLHGATQTQETPS
jgi:DNA-binding MarR family transcriptional regulator